MVIGTKPTPLNYVIYWFISCFNTPHEAQGHLALFSLIIFCELESYPRKQMWVASRNCFGISLGELRKTTNVSVRIAGVVAEIRTKSPPR